MLLCSLCPCLASSVQLPRQAMHVEAEAALWIHVQRAYLGPTSMDTEMAFIMCNLGQVWAFSCLEALSILIAHKQYLGSSPGQILVLLKCVVTS